MEPKSLLPNPSPETGGGYHRSEVPQAPAEVTSHTPEKPLAPELPSSAPPPSLPASPSPAPTLPTLPVPTAVPQPTVQPASDNPLVAGDEEVMEKEWVDRAKKIVAQTKDDPYAQEKEVSKLQADYLKKRYGKEIKLTDE